MDKVPEMFLKDFSRQQGIENEQESKRFEHFACWLAVGLHTNEMIDTGALSVGQATGIDSVAVIINGRVILDIDELAELSGQNLDVVFVFVHRSINTTEQIRWRPPNHSVRCLSRHQNSR